MARRGFQVSGNETGILLQIFASNVYYYIVILVERRSLVKKISSPSGRHYKRQLATSSHRVPRNTKKKKLAIKKIDKSKYHIISLRL